MKISVSRNLGEKEIFPKAENVTGCVRNNTEYYENQHQGYSYGIRIKEWKSILVFYMTMNMTVDSTLLYKKATPSYVSVCSIKGSL